MPIDYGPDPIEELLEVAVFVGPDRWMCSAEDKQKYQRWHFLMNTLIEVLEASDWFADAFYRATEAAEEATDADED